MSNSGGDHNGDVTSDSSSGVVPGSSAPAGPSPTPIANAGIGGAPNDARAQRLAMLRRRQAQARTNASVGNPMARTGPGLAGRPGGVGMPMHLPVQQQQQAAAAARQQQSRQDVIQKAVDFLTHPKVRDTPVDRRLAFLRDKKGLTQDEVEEACRRAGVDPNEASPSGSEQHASTATTTTTTTVPQAPMVPQQQQAMHQPSAVVGAAGPPPAAAYYATPPPNNLVPFHQVLAPPPPPPGPSVAAMALGGLALLGVGAVAGVLAKKVWSAWYPSSPLEARAPPGTPVPCTPITGPDGIPVSVATPATTVAPSSLPSTPWEQRPAVEDPRLAASERKAAKKASKREKKRRKRAAEQAAQQAEREQAAVEELRLSVVEAFKAQSQESQQALEAIKDVLTQVATPTASASASPAAGRTALLSSRAASGDAMMAEQRESLERVKNDVNTIKQMLMTRKLKEDTSAAARRSSINPPSPYMAGVNAASSIVSASEVPQGSAQVYQQPPPQPQPQSQPPSQQQWQSPQSQPLQGQSSQPPQAFQPQQPFQQHSQQPQQPQSQHWQAQPQQPQAQSHHHQQPHEPHHQQQQHQQQHASHQQQTSQQPLPQEADESSTTRQDAAYVGPTGDGAEAGDGDNIAGGSASSPSPGTTTAVPTNGSATPLKPWEKRRMQRLQSARGNVMGDGSQDVSSAATGDDDVDGAESMHSPSSHGSQQE